MDTFETDLIKCREIAFAALHPDPAQARTAALMLADIQGIIKTLAVSPTLLQVNYHVLHVSLEQIEEGLVEVGFHLSSRLIYRVKRALFYYTEETQRANNGCPRGSGNCTQKIFINRYSSMDHGCRDHRPKHWRKYL